MELYEYIDIGIFPFIKKFTIDVFCLLPYFFLIRMNISYKVECVLFFSREYLFIRGPITAAVSLEHPPTLLYIYLIQSSLLESYIIIIVLIIDAGSQTICSRQIL